MHKKTILFTIELSDRELFPKCLLAIEMIKAGFRVYIGTFRSIHETRNRIKSCIFFHKSSYVRRIQQYRRDMGAVVAIMDEETGVAIPAHRMTDFCHERFGKLPSQDYDYIFTIGEGYRSRLSALKNLDGVKILATGWPRIDLWREEYSVIHQKKLEEIRQQHGDYILFISSFGFTSRTGYEFKLKRAPSESRIRALHNTFNALNNYIELISRLAAETREKIVVRPHISESIEEWKSIFSAYPNVTVCREGDVAPWLLGATGGVITYRSTVTLQAALNGIPTVQYKINDIDGIDDVPVFKVSKCVETYEEVVSHLNRYKTNAERDELRLQAIEVLRDDVSSLSGQTAANKIATILAEVDVQPQPEISVPPLMKAMFFGWDRYKYMEHRTRKLLFKKRASYRPSRFDKIPNGIRTEEIRSIIDRLIQADDSGWSGDNISCQQVSVNLVMLQASESPSGLDSRKIPARN